MTALNKFKIPTILGLGIIFFGISAGVYLVMRQQTFLSRAASDLTPQNITITNVTEDSVTVSWQTPASTISFINYGQGDLEQQANLDDRDKIPVPHLIHYITLKNLFPKTKYQFQIISGKKQADVIQFETAQPANSQTGFTPIIGSVLDGNTPLTDGIAYLSISGANPQSSLIKINGNFLIPVSQIRKEDFSDIFPLTEDTLAKLTIVSDKGRATALFKLKPTLKPLPPLILGQDIDLTTPVQELNQYDLNSDGEINATDNAIILNNIGTNPKDKRGDLNKDGVVDQKDVDLMSPHINQ